MVKRLLMVLMLFLALFSGAEVSAKTNAKIKFEHGVYDFGNIKEAGGPVSHEFTFVNEGTEPLEIKSARAECGCTKPEFSSAPIPPGGKGKIKVTYNPLGRPGGFTKVVTVRTNGSPGKINLKIRGSVVPK